MKVTITTACALSVASALGARPGRVQVSGEWEITVQAGKIAAADGQALSFGKTVLSVPPHTAVHVQAEKHPRLPIFAEKGGGWRRGARLRRLITQECTAAGALVPESLVVSTPEGKPMEKGADYMVEPFWGTVGRADAGKIAADSPVLVSYAYYPNRIHAIAVSPTGRLRLVEGTPGLGAQLPPELKPDETCLARIWLSGPVTRLQPENILEIDGTSPPASEWTGTAKTLCPKTVAKLQAGEPVGIVAWGDSVTNGGGVGRTKEQWYQSVFLSRLKKRFPNADISLKTAAWPGGNSRGYMSAPPGGKYDFKRDVLDPKPDLVTIEFVNDAGWHGKRLDEHYGKILDILRQNGAEVILITPHFVRPDWMKVTSLKFDDDPRPYVKSLRDFARRNHVALADASLLWGHLWREGIPYPTLEANSINHPDERGHRLFADALMGLF